MGYVILWTEEDATKEVTRLNNLEKKRAEKKGSHFTDSEYFWEVSRAKKR